MKKFLPALFCLSCFPMLQAQAPAPKRILFLGDSLAAGYGLGKQYAFPALIQNKIDNAGMAYRVINAGVSGDTTAGGLRRVDWILRQPIHVLVLELGANDGLRGVPPEETKRNLKAIMDKTRAKNPGVKILLAGMLMPPNLGADYAEAFAKVYPDLADSEKTQLIPFLLEKVAGKPQLNLPDGIHPTIDGQKLVAETVWEHLKPMLGD